MAIGVWLTHSLTQSISLWQKADGDADNSAAAVEDDDDDDNNNNNNDYNQEVVPLINN
jgi:hypothetical protein